MPNRRNSGASALRIVVLGYIVRGPFGGMTWHHLQYIMGLRDLGHDVYFFEDSDDYPSCYNPDTFEMGTDPTYGLEYTRKCFDRAGLPGRWVYYDGHSDTWHGPLSGRAAEIARTADLLINVSGVNPIRPWFEGIGVRAFLDTDPVFTQVRNLTSTSYRARALEHTVFFSFGEAIAAGRSKTPDDGLSWRATRQPVVLDAWPVVPAAPDAPFTTVMQWDSYPPVTYGGMEFGMKSKSFQPFLALPRDVEVPLEIALGSGPREELRSNGWRVVDGVAVTLDPWTHQSYIQASRGEFAIAKHGYVEGRCGWFSERSAGYLASGRPAIVQDTGFGDWLQTDGGVLAFRTPQEAAECLKEVCADYERHAKLARAAAATYFAADKVLKHLIDECFRSAQ